MIKDISKFAIIGAIGFLVDAGALKLYLVLIDNDPIFGRLFSFPIAVTATWLLNRRYTFEVSPTKEPLYKEWGRYVTVNGFGFGINLLVYLSIVAYSSQLAQYPLIVLAIASIVAMFFNYFGSRYLVFR